MLAFAPASAAAQPPSGAATQRQCRRRLMAPLLLRLGHGMRARFWGDVLWGSVTRGPPGAYSFTSGLGPVLAKHSCRPNRAAFARCRQGVSTGPGLPRAVHAKREEPRNPRSFAPSPPPPPPPVGAPVLVAACARSSLCTRRPLRLGTFQRPARHSFYVTVFHLLVSARLCQWFSLRPGVRRTQGRPFPVPPGSRTDFYVQGTVFSPAVRLRARDLSGRPQRCCFMAPTPHKWLTRSSSNEQNLVVMPP